MAAYSVTRFDAIDEIHGDGVPYRPVRQHFGITSFGISSLTGQKRGDRIINEHSEEDDQEELYLVLQGRASFELEGERVDAPAGTLVFAEPGVRRTAFAEEDGTTVVVVGGKPGKAYEVLGFEAWAPFNPLYEAGDYAEAADQARGTIEAYPRRPEPSSALRAARRSPAAQTTRRGISGMRSSGRSAFGTSPAETPTSTRSATGQKSPSYSRGN